MARKIKLMTKTKIFFVAGLLIGAFHYTLAQSVQKTIKRLPDTGQTTSYTTTPGEDADYNINPPFFINNSNGTITDTITGLMWQQVDGGEMTFDKATTYASNLVLGGYSDWRMPNIKELQSISEATIYNPSINKTYFSGISTTQCWASTSLSNQSTKAWYLDTQYGITSQALKTNKLRLLAVRSATTVTSVSTLSKAKESLNIYPNPGTGLFAHKADEPLGEIRIINQLGQTILNTNTNEKVITLFLSEKGIFQLICRHNQMTISKSIVVL
jgi:hypothetical protein